MSYIGRGTDKISNIEKLDTITFDGSSSYTLQKNSVNFTPNSANSLQVSIDGVVQAGNFTVSGSTIDFGVAIPSTSTCDFIFHYGTGLITTPADGTVGLAQLSATGTKDSTTFLRGDNSFAEVPAGGITEADQWRLTTNFTGSADPITSNLERIDNATRGNGTLGTGMTESSGIFTFPSTGIWLIKFYHNSFLNGDDRAVGAYIQTTVDNSNYDVASEGEGFITQTNSNTTLNSSAQEVLFDVTNTTTHKCRFRIDVLTATTTTQGNTNINKTYMTFIRLGDT